MLNQFFKFASATIIILGFVIIPVYANVGLMPAPTDNALNPTGITPSVNTVEKMIKIIIYVLNAMYVIFFIVAIICVLLAAYAYLVNAGEPESIKSAHKQLVWAAVAIVVALISVSANIIIKDFIE